MDMKELVQKLNDYGYKYYVLDQPTISDKQYDELYDTLVAMEKEKGEVLPNSPTRRIGGAVLEGFKKHTHLHKLYSLDKAQSVDAVKSWVERAEKTIGQSEYSVEYKFDGLTMNLTYSKGEFVRATTRGDGSIGEDVTAQVMTIKSFPLTIDYKGDVEVVGEAIMYLSTLEKYNENNAVPLKNARNAVAGAIRNLDPKETAKRSPHIIFYSINYIQDENLIKSQTDVIEFLKNNKFKTSPFFKVAKTSEDIEKAIEEIGSSRSKLDFLIDGVVIKVDKYSSRQELGFTEKFPKWAVAFKFEAEETTTILKDVIWQVGRTGKLTPLAILEPQDLCGVTVSRATLNNFSDIERKDVAINDRVFIRRSNDVIPEILGLAERYDNSLKISKPTTCPSCNSPVIEKGAHLFCSNELDCPDQITLRLTHFASRNAMDIEGFSEKTAKAFHNTLGIRQSFELYSITKEQLLTVEGFKDKKAENFLKAIEKSKKISFDKLIYAIGILNVGTKTAKDLAATFKDINELKTATAERLVSIQDVGDIVANSIVEFFADEVAMTNLDKLLEILQVDYKVQKATEGVLLNEIVCLTGVLQNFKRSEATKILESMGATVTTSVTAKTTLVVYGEDAGSKLAKAEKLGTKLMTENDFISLINKEKDK